MPNQRLQNHFLGEETETMADVRMSWIGPRGGEIIIAFDDDFIRADDMRNEVDRFLKMNYKNLPDEIPKPAAFQISRDGKKMALWWAGGEQAKRDFI
jgi:hypothetical protein